MSSKQQDLIFQDQDIQVLEAVQRRREVIVNDYFRTRRSDNIDIESEKMVLSALKDMETQHIQKARLRIAGKVVDNAEVNTKLLAEALKGAKHLQPKTKQITAKEDKHVIPEKYLDVDKSVPGENVQLEDVNPSQHHYED